MAQEKQVKNIAYLPPCKLPGCQQVFLGCISLVGESLRGFRGHVGLGKGDKIPMCTAATKIHPFLPLSCHLPTWLLTPLLPRTTHDPPFLPPYMLLTTQSAIGPHMEPLANCASGPTARHSDAPFVTPDWDLWQRIMRVTAVSPQQAALKFNWQYYAHHLHQNRHLLQQHTKLEKQLQTEVALSHLACLPLKEGARLKNSISQWGYILCASEPTKNTIDQIRVSGPEFTCTHPFTSHPPQICV